ncbi:MAG: hypothetical protein V3T72_04870 [Thermoanaerobaculia bacterium]
MGDSATHPLADRVARFVRRPDPDAFAELALAAFAHQYDRLAAYRRLCASAGVEPGSISDWRQIPAIPVLAYQTLELSTAPAVEIFRSSGTTGGQRSVHGHPFPDLYRLVIDRTFPRYCLRSEDERPPMLALVPRRRQIADSSLGFMVDHVVDRFGGDGSRYAFDERGVDVEAACGWCRDLQRDGRPGLILATSFALAQWLQALADDDRRFRLPPGTRVFDTGGFKGRVREISRDQLLADLEERLGVAADRVVREYGMTELTSQFYTDVLRGGDGDVFVGPPWLEARILDPVTLREAPAGESGLVTIFDLANLGSAVHLLVQDIGIADGGGLRLLGRASGAELRGCSLTVEMLEAGAFRG